MSSTSSAASDTLEKVASEFQSEVLADLEEGRVQALAVIDMARREAAEAVSKILETGVKQAESTKRQVIGAAELQARNAQLKALERAVNEVFERSVKEVSTSSGPSYEKALLGLITEGLEVIGAKARVHCPAKDKKNVSAAIRKLGGKDHRVSLEDKPVDSIGGVVLTSADGSVRFDNTFEARLERARPELRKEVAGILTA